jgi:hypothetical protein
MKSHFTSETLYYSTPTECVGGWSTELVRMFWRTEISLHPQGLIDLAKYSSTIERHSSQKFTLALSHEKEELLAYLYQLS